MNTPSDEPQDNPWMVTLVQAQLDEMAGVCNELNRIDRDIKFIVPIAQAPEVNGHLRPASHIAVFSVPKSEDS